MVYKALGREATEQALHDTLFEVQMNDFIGDFTGIFEYHRANRRVPGRRRDERNG